MSPLERNEFISAVELIRSDIKGVSDRLDAINGRTRDVEQNVAVLFDRSDGVREEAKVAGRRTASKWGALIAGGAAVAEVLHQWWGK